MVKRAVHRMLIGLIITVLLIVGVAGSVAAQAAEPRMLHSGLGVRAVVADLVTPIGVAFLAANDMLVIEKNTGRVQRIVDGEFDSTVLDLAVNFASERGLLGIALHPNFPTNRRSICTGRAGRRGPGLTTSLPRRVSATRARCSVPTPTSRSPRRCSAIGSTVSCGMPRRRRCRSTST